jgi:fructoselysine 6-kinase
MGSEVTTAPFSVAGVGDNTVDVYVDEGVGYPGGNALNFSVFARRLGVESAYIGVLGSDARGDHVRQALSEEGIAIDLVRRSDRPNSVALVTHANGDRQFLGSDPGTSQSLVIQKEDGEYLSGMHHVHTSVFSKLDGSLSALGPYGGTLSYDFSNKFDRTLLETTLPYLDFAFLSFAGRPLEGISSFLTELRGHSPAEVVVTAGSAGSCVLDDGGNVLHRLPRSIRPVDTLGAGDAFITRYLLARLTGTPKGESLELGNAFASQMCMTKGSFGWQVSVGESEMSALQGRIERHAQGSAS